MMAFRKFIVTPFIIIAIVFLTISLLIRFGMEKTNIVMSALNTMVSLVKENE